MQQKKKYLVTIRYPAEVEQNETVRWVEVNAANPQKAAKSAQVMASKWIKTPVISEIDDHGIAILKIYANKK